MILKNHRCTAAVKSLDTPLEDLCDWSNYLATFSRILLIARSRSNQLEALGSRPLCVDRWISAARLQCRATCRTKMAKLRSLTIRGS